MSIQTACSFPIQPLSSFEIRSADFDGAAVKIGDFTESRLQADFFFMTVTVCFGSVAASGRVTRKQAVRQQEDRMQIRSSKP
jgi:hypothetical protein